MSAMIYIEATGYQNFYFHFLLYIIELLLCMIYVLFKRLDYETQI